MLSLLALASSACWGTSDFFAGLKSKSHARGGGGRHGRRGSGLSSSPLVVGVRPRGPGVRGLASGSVAAGLAGATGLVCFYAALSSGTMGVVAPVASLGVVVPVLLGLAAGEQPPASAWFGHGCWPWSAIALASGPELSGDVSPRPVVLACVAAVGFGFALVLPGPWRRASRCCTPCGGCG